jgi:hypothetical protein
MIRHLILSCASLLLLTAGCESREVQPEVATPEASQTAVVQPAAQETYVKASPLTSATMLLHDPSELQRFEVTSQALQLWYNVRRSQPALLLYSNDPLLRSNTPAIQKNLLARLAEKDTSALRFDIADPAILPKMTLHAALQAGLFSQVYWMMPISADMSALSIETFRTQMMQIGALSAEESRTFTLRNGVFSGIVRGVPFHALHPKADFSITGPTVFHFDLSYLSPLYKNEIKTPLYPLLYQTLIHLRNQQIEQIAASFSYSQVTFEIPLGSRFIGDIFVQLFNQPNRLDEKLPETWQVRANALYLPELFNAEEGLNLLLQQVEEHPDDPSLHYALYHLSRETKSARHKALNHLAVAVQYDPVYALEYLTLAPVAREKGRPDEALRVLRLAHNGYTDNPFITLELIRALLATGLGDEALPLLQEVQALNWSASIYPDMPAFLQQQATEADNQANAEPANMRRQQ